MKKIFKIAGIVFGAILLIAIVFAGIEGISPIAMGIHSPIYQKSGVALDGYDVVAYFDAEATKGDGKFSTQWEGIDWHFSSSENLKAFLDNPEMYQPQFGGYCTKAVSTGFTAPVDPTVYTLKDDKLYLFSGEEVKTEFMINPESITMACEEKWEKN